VEETAECTDDRGRNENGSEGEAKSAASASGIATRIAAELEEPGDDPLEPGGQDALRARAACSSSER
jgi:hypothetical protein